MKLLPLLFAGAVASGTPLLAVAQGAPWAQPLSSAAATRITHVVTDASNNTFVAGYARGAATFGAQPLAAGSAQLTNGFVARLGPTGTVQWVRMLASASFGTEAGATGLALDGAGNVVLCGAYRYGSLALGAATLPATTTPGQANGLVAKLDPAGNVLWAQAMTAPNASLDATAVTVDAAGTAYVAIESQNTALASGLGLRTFSSAGVPGSSVDFPGVTGVAATSPLGVFGFISALAVNPTTGQLAAVGKFQGTLTLRATGTVPALAFTSPPEPANGAFVVGLSPAGVAQWGQQLTSTGYVNGSQRSFLNQLNGIAPLGTGFVVAGGYLGSGTLAGTALPGTSTSTNITAVLARLDGQGQLQWSRPVEGIGAGEGALARAVATDATGQIHVAGLMVGQLAANGGGLTSAGGADALLLRYSEQGQLLGARRDGDVGNESPYAIALDPTGQPVIAGDFVGLGSLGGVYFTTNGQANGFVARLAHTPLATRAGSAVNAALQVFPNPGSAGAALQVKLLASTTAATVRLLNVLGQPVYQQQVPARTATATVPTAGLAPGRYVLQVMNSEGIATRGVVVE